MRLHRTGTRAGIFVGLMLAAACAARGQTELSSDPAGTPADRGQNGSSTGSTPEADSGPAEQFTSTDAASGGTFDCKPGTYAGTFETNVSSDAGGVFAFFSFDFKGTLSIVVVGQVSQGAGEVPRTTYSIAPGAKLTGADQTFGGSYSADLTGQLDCATRTFNGTVNDGVYSIVFDAGSLPMEGSLTGLYDGGDARAPELHGTTILSSPQFPTVAAAGTWTASLQ